MKHIICKHMLNHVDLYKMHTALQHGFRNGFACETQLLVILHNLIKYKDNKIQAYIIIPDFWKPFGTIPHDKLLYKLRFYGKTEDILNWISVFLK